MTAVNTDPHDKLHIIIFRVLSPCSGFMSMSNRFWLRQGLKEGQSLSVHHGDKLSRTLNIHFSGSDLIL